MTSLGLYAAFYNHIPAAMFERGPVGLPSERMASHAPKTPLLPPGVRARMHLTLIVPASYVTN